MEADAYDAYSPVRLSIAYLRKAQESGDDTMYAKAEEAARRALTIRPDYASARLLLAQSLSAQHRFGEAIAEAESGRASAPEDYHLTAVLADAWLSKGDLARAEAEIERLDRAAPRLQVLVLRANLQEARGQHAAAVRTLRKALRQGVQLGNDDRVWVLVRSAEILTATGQWEEAEASLVAALRLAPKSQYARSTLATLRADQDRIDDAIAITEKLIAEQPHPERFELLATLLERAGSTDAARATRDRAAEGYAESLAAGSTHDLRFAARFYVDVLPDPERALACARRDLELRQDALAWDALAWALHANGEFAAAADAMTQALASGIRSADVFYHAARIHLSLGDLRSARKHLRAVLAVNSRDRRRAEVEQLLAHR